MSQRATILDASVFTIGGGNLLASMKDCEYRWRAATDDGKPAVRPGASAQAVKRSATLRTTQMSVISDPAKVTNLHLAEISIGGHDFIADLRGGSFSGTMQHDEGSGAAAQWTYPNFVGKDYSAQVQMAVPPTFVTTLEDFLHDTDETGLPVDFLIDINGVTTEVPMLITEYGHLFRENAIQMIECSLMGRSPDSGAYPTDPTGTTSLLDKAFNAPQTALALVLTSKAAGGRSRTGNFLFSGFGFDFNDQAIIKTNYEFANVGAVGSAQTV